MSSMSARFYLRFSSLSKRILERVHVVQSSLYLRATSGSGVKRFKSTYDVSLTDEQKKQYEAEGYLVVHDVFDKEHIQKMKDALDECEEKAKTMTESTKYFTLDPNHTLTNPMLQRVHHPTTLFPVFQETVRDKTLLDIVEQLIGPNIRYIAQEKVNLKLPRGTRFPVKWHQDWAFYPHTNQNMVMASISIDNSTRENGCLQVIPKSHKGPLFSHFKDGEFAAAINDDRFDPSSAVYVEVPSGGVSLHHGRTVHGSATNNSDHKRRLSIFLYCSTDAWPLLGVTSFEYGNIGPVDWERFTSTIVRGETTLYPKMEAVPVSLPVPFDKGGYVFEQKETISSSHRDPQN